MLDIQYIRDNPKLVKDKSQQKGYKVDVDKLLQLDQDRKKIQSELQDLRAKRNSHSESLAGAKPSDQQISIGKQLKEDIAKLEAQLEPVDQQFNELLKTVPNMPLDDVPVGDSEEDNQVVKTVGEKPEFDFKPKNHAQIAEAKGWLDKTRAAKVAGSRFAYLKGDLVLLDWAMNMFALSKLTDQQFIADLVKANNLNISSKPFVAVQPPAVAKTKVFEATGRLNKEEQTYKLEDEDLWLNASAEHVLAPMFLNEIVPHEELPIRLVGYTTAFRREAGTYGKDMEGIFRLHQFNKLEMEGFSDSESGLSEHLLYIAIQESLFEALELPYRLLNKCTADIGGPNARGVDIDVWLPGQGRYRESHTADYMTDFQTRSMKSRYRDEQGNIHLLHTNDATVFSQRPLIAIIENYQTKDGDVIIPKVLRPFMGGRERI